MHDNIRKPSAAFIGASWAALLLGMGAYLAGLWNADMALNERGYYFTLLLYGLFAAISLQKSVRDRLEGLPVTALYYGLAWFAVISALLLLFIGLWNAELALSEKGFYGMAYALSLFAAIAVQKNTRDTLAAEDRQEASVHPLPRRSDDIEAG
ncbi:inner membrane protein YiaA [Marilutibacter alkalisoli]|uniref:YiaAB two helix domain-containing protein n=1 Tax=Marilutibacter alkalisoli TaxID=2591633 RepID=A0A514BN59_9GAMM|nr:inner membrane protein YiaA [Lysobacter alkalisoli]QDH68826.1 hypothetical protein FKV23_00895 [Lysobacter alkalisoli]